MLHVLFEDDVIPKWEQETEAKSKVRSSIYEGLYNRPYKYAVDSSSNGQRSASGTMGMPDLPDDLPEPAERETKPYVPPTDLGDLPDILDAPMGEE